MLGDKVEGEVWDRRGVSHQTETWLPIDHQNFSKVEAQKYKQVFPTEQVSIGSYPLSRLKVIADVKNKWINIK